MKKFIALLLAALLASTNLAFAQIVNSVIVTAPIVICQSGTSVAHTGDTVEAALVSCKIPGGRMGPNSSIEISFIGLQTASTNSKTWRIRVGTANDLTGITCVSGSTVAAANSGFNNPGILLQNRNSLSSQVCGLSPSISGFGNGNVQTYALNSANDIWIVISGLLTLGTESISVEGYRIALFP